MCCNPHTNTKPLYQHQTLALNPYTNTKPLHQLLHQPPNLCTNPCTTTLCTVHMPYLFDTSMIHLTWQPFLTTGMAFIVANMLLRFQIHGLSMLKPLTLSGEHLGLL